MFLVFPSLGQPNIGLILLLSKNSIEDKIFLHASKTSNHQKPFPLPILSLPLPSHPYTLHLKNVSFEFGGKCFLQGLAQSYELVLKDYDHPPSN
jgi:hypothetical protein